MEGLALEDLPETIVALRDTVRQFARERLAPLVPELDAEGHHATGAVDELIKRGCEIGLFSGFLPRKYGGTITGLAAAVAMEELAAVDSGIATFFGSVGLGLTPIALSGDRRLFERYFPEVAEGERQGKPVLWAFSITEPEAGSDVEDTEGSRVARLGTIAVREGDEYVLNGRKVFCSLGNLAKYISVFACVGERSIDTWTCFVVPTSTPGFSIGRVERKLGQRACPAAELVFDNVRIPVENRVGEEGQGWDLNRQTLAVSRPTVGAIGLGIARAAYDHALAYAMTRHQGGKKIVEHQLTQYKLARIAMQIEMVRDLVHRASAHRPASLKLSSMAKVAGSDLAVAATSEAIQIYGGYGYMQDAPVEKLYRDAKITQIYEGTNEMNLLAAMEAILDERNFRRTGS